MITPLVNAPLVGSVRGAFDFRTFNPLTIPGLALWLDASDLSSITGGASVSQWNDKSGLGNHVTQSNATFRPASGSATVNGRNALTFDGTDDHLLVPSGLNAIGAGPNTIFAVYRNGSGGNATQRIIMGTTATGRYGLANTATSVTFANRSADSGTSPVTAARDTNTHAAVGYRSGTTLRTYRDGGTPNTRTDAQDVTIDVSFTVGGLNTSGARFKGEITEILAATTALSADWTNLIGGYLSAKWGYTWNAVS